MTEIKRYEFELYHCNGGEMLASPEGGYVDYDDHAAEVARLNEQVRALAAEVQNCRRFVVEHLGPESGIEFSGLNTDFADTVLREVGAKARKEGAYFVANRILAAWEAGFVEDTAENAADIARMILTATECMADAPQGDFDRSFADEVLQGIAASIRAGKQP